VAPGAAQPGAATGSAGPRPGAGSCQGRGSGPCRASAGSLCRCWASLTRQASPGSRRHRLTHAEPTSLGSGSPDDQQQSAPLPPEDGPAPRPGRRRRRRSDDEAGCSDSQEAAACSYQDPAHGSVSSRAGRAGQLTGGWAAGRDQFLHLLAVGEALIKAEGVAQQDRRAAWAEVRQRAAWGPGGGRTGQGALPGECIGQHMNLTVLYSVL
jgi:hypothetical protein